jgi:hypothetical protein
LLICCDSCSIPYMLLSKHSKHVCVCV